MKKNSIKIIILLLLLMVSSCSNVPVEVVEAFDYRVIRDELEDTFDLALENQIPSPILSYTSTLTQDEASSLIFWLGNQQTKEDSPFILVSENMNDESIAAIVYNGEFYCLISMAELEQFSEHCFIYNDYKIIRELNKPIKVYISNDYRDDLIFIIE